MAVPHGSFGVLWIDDTGGTCRNMTGDITAITFNRTKNLPEATTLGNQTVQRMDGLRDVTLDVTALYDSISTPVAVVGLLDQMWSNSAFHRTQYLPGGSATGCPIYTACMRLANYVVNQPVDGPVTVNFSLANASNAMTAACCV